MGAPSGPSEQIRLSLRLAPGFTGVPYYRPPELGHEYVDLRASPDMIDALPELRSFPTLRHVVAALNASGAFQTVGCAAWAGPVSNPGAAPGQEIQLQTYVEFCFTDPFFAVEPWPLYQVFHAYADYALGHGLFRATAGDFAVRLVQFHLEGRPAWGATLSLLSFGASEDEARAAQAPELEALLGVLTPTADA